MIRKNLFFEKEQVDKINDLLANHPEIGTFSAAIRWMIQTYQEPTAEEMDSPCSEKKMVALQQKLNVMSKEQQLQTQGLFNLLRAMNVETGKDISSETTYLDARRAVDSQINRAVTARSSHTGTHEIE